MMKAEGQQTLGQGDKKAEPQRATEKEEITSTELPEGGNTIYLQRNPRHLKGEKNLFEDFPEKTQVNES